MNFFQYSTEFKNLTYHIA